MMPTDKTGSKHAGRFQKGTSGNLNGRPKGARNTATKLNRQIARLGSFENLAHIRGATMEVFGEIHPIADQAARIYVIAEASRRKATPHDLKRRLGRGAYALVATGKS